MHECILINKSFNVNVHECILINWLLKQSDKSHSQIILYFIVHENTRVIFIQKEKQLSSPAGEKKKAPLLRRRNNFIGRHAIFPVHNIVDGSSREWSSNSIR